MLGPQSVIENTQDFKNDFNSRIGHPLYPAKYHTQMPQKSLPPALISKPLHTKVVCTIGPSSSSKSEIKKMIDGGVSTVRLNMAHCTREFATKYIKDLRDVVAESESSAQVGIWIDVNGPKVRTGKLKDGGKPVYLEAGSTFTFVNGDHQTIVGDETFTATTFSKNLDLEAGDRLFIEDGILSFTVTERVDNGVQCTVDNSGWLAEHKGITLPSSKVQNLPPVSQSDQQDIMWALEQNVDFLSVSCIRNSEDIEEVRMILGNSKVRLLAKIESAAGLVNYDSILKMADAVVIDRGYLGAEVEIDLVPSAQKKMIQLANAAGKPIMVANQVLDSMIERPRPSRSEAADVANAVMDGVDGLVLSAETAVGKYVMECVETMRKIALQAELANDYYEYQQKLMKSIPKPIAVSESIASSAVTCARQVGAAVIICFTEMGGTARLVAKYRPQSPVIGATMYEKTARQLNMCFGIVPYFHEGDNDNIIAETLKYAVALKLAKPGQTAVLTSGQVIGFLEGTTTKMQVVQIPE